SLQNMEGAWAKFRLGMGGTDFQTAMARLGLHGPQDFKNFATLSSHLMAVKRMYGEQAALASANALGIDKHTFLMLMQGPQKVRELYEKAYRLNGVTGQNVREAQLLWEKWVDLKEVFAADGQVIFHDLVPALGALMTDAEDLLHAFTRVDKATDGWAGKILALGAAIMTLRAPFALLKSGAGLLGAKGATEGAEAAASGGILGKAFGWLGVAGRAGVIGLLANAGLDMVDPKDKAGSWIDQHVWGASWLDNEASKIGLGRSYAQQRAAAMGSTGAGGSLPRGLRNNNPGNIRYGKFARAHGATGADSSGFAIFPTLRAGERAMAALLQDYKARGIDTIAGIVSRYAPSSENNTGAYIASVSSQTGIGANTPLSASQYAAVQRAMMIQENGGAYARMLGPGATAPVVASGGHTSVETNIGSIHVNAPNATDADGVAGGMKKALAYNTLISGGMVGVT
ncbi:MAG: hypothetical protein KGL42_17475, partial [Betaproteobacteria bacterium]|nr:hypothetical protein [Betaproteobacteria bacterium]